MAIRVIEETPDPSVVKRVICRNCGVTLEYVPLDVTTRQITDYTGGRDDYHSIKCPKCNNEISVSKR